MPFPAPAPLPFVISAASAAALRDGARRLADHVRDHGELRLEDVARTLATTDAGLAHRAVVLGDDADGLASGLGGLAENTPVAHVVQRRGRCRRQGRCSSSPARELQWPGMASAISWSTPRSSPRACARAPGHCPPPVDWSPAEGVLRQADAGRRRSNASTLSQRVLLPRSWCRWRRCGVPYGRRARRRRGPLAGRDRRRLVAGALSLEDGARVVALRSRGDRRRARRAGGMVSLPLPRRGVDELTARGRDRLSVAALNGPARSWSPASPSALDELLAELRGRRGTRPPDRGGLRLALRAGRADREERLESWRPSAADGAGPVLLHGDRRAAGHRRSWTPATGTGTCAGPCGSTPPSGSCWPTGTGRSSRSARTRC